jgi:hypothetical protein
VVSSWSAPFVSAVQWLFRPACDPHVHNGCDDGEHGDLEQDDQQLMTEHELG